ncbi:universal stress protein [Mycobacterium nebraskense]|uniref:Universal stress protein n=1 Tax=Mycobacterium nebraskense TaxID=244292 RepID=A0A0F5N9Z7_9MYCO|nr:universal stress protein [Mycobacterium nebraskense]KKC03846.1 universal stress protein [Mycobacterium nebraskense]KLO39691.1 universal stress protein [Mycobacterium nebraskense]MBI2695426.1 universal stress protein [Mycobacterium nebraskense]ORW30258.1 universal stress protein [Mycobacterium nebraskense]
MNNPQSQRIVVGIDGSDAAINAAKWAAAEAVSRNVPLRLIHAIPQRHADASGDESLDIEYAQTSLRAADAALQAMGTPVKVECDIVRGSSESALIDESRHAAMVCVGSVGTGWVARKVLGSTAGTVAQKAHCPVAVIRSGRDVAEPDGGYVAVAVQESETNDAVLEHGFREARLREAPILAMGVWRWGLGEIPYRQLDHRLGPWVSRHREVHVQPAAARRGAAEFLTHTQEPVQLAVVGSEDADKVARMVGPITPHPGGHTGCSVLVVRD